MLVKVVATKKPIFGKQSVVVGIKQSKPAHKADRLTRQGG